MPRPKIWVTKTVSSSPDNLVEFHLRYEPILHQYARCWHCMCFFVRPNPSEAPALLERPYRIYQVAQTKECIRQKYAYEPTRNSRRHLTLRRWSHEQLEVQLVFLRGERTRRLDPGNAWNWPPCNGCTGLATSDRSNLSGTSHQPRLSRTTGGNSPKRQRLPAQLQQTSLLETPGGSVRLAWSSIAIGVITNPKLSTATLFILEL